MYNPYSVLNALDIKGIRPFWYETGTPSFLARRIRKNGIAPMDINGVTASIEDLTSVGFDEIDPIPLMFFEFKYNKSVEEAMAQIHSRDYAGRYAMDPRTVYLIGANFDENKGIGD